MTQRPDESALYETGADPVPDDTPRIPNPFVRFQTRSQWLAVVIRRGRDANPKAPKTPSWFNR